jgi:hypothetical protein
LFLTIYGKVGEWLEQRIRLLRKFRQGFLIR